MRRGWYHKTIASALDVLRVCGIAANKSDIYQQNLAYGGHAVEDKEVCKIISLISRSCLIGRCFAFVVMATIISLIARTSCNDVGRFHRAPD
jgi:hypothetical protein